MKVSYFKTYLDTSPSVSKDVSFFLDRIRDGASKDIISKLRTASTEEEESALKKSLPLVCFNGHFTRRAKAGLKKSSGLMILDFDDFNSTDEAKELKETLKKDKHVFSTWFSPRMGVKALYRIIDVLNDEEFKEVYSQVKDKYPNLDDSGKDISRMCFESYDPNIYVNLEAEVFIPEVVEALTEENNDIGQVTNIPLKDQDVIANRLIVWFKDKEHFDPSKRNNSIFKLASAFNNFGVSKSTALNYCMSYAKDSSKLKEVQKVIESAYKKTSSFGTQFFEDTKKKKKLTNMVLTGKKQKEIEKHFSDIDKEALATEVEVIKNTVRVDEFWKFDFNGKMIIDPYMFKLYLQNLNYYKYYPVGNDKTFVFITKESNFLDNINEFQMKDRVMNNLLVNDEIDVFNSVANQTRLFTSQYLSMIETADVSIEKDGKDYAMIYFKNTAIKVTQSKVEEIDYDDLDGHIWTDQVIKRNFTNADHHESMFRSFVWYISGQETERYNTMKSIIGYLLHSYKTSANNKAIILNDEVISDNPNGGSGKGLLTNAISQMKKVSTIDGKTFDFNKSFPYQTVATDCQVLAFDDVKKNFNFEQLFSIITEGITIEYKGKDAIKIPIKDSPKVLISTNYTLKADGGSFERRMFEVELSSYFGSHHSPLDQFGCMLFDDWDDLEWARFDHFMVNCVQYYLEHGLVTYEQKNLKIRKLMNETAREFYEWMESKDEPRNLDRIYYKQWMADFTRDYNDFDKWLTQRLFNTWIKKYYSFKNISLSSGSTNGQRYYQIDLPDQAIDLDEEDDVWDEIEKKYGI